MARVVSKILSQYRTSKFNYISVLKMSITSNRCYVCYDCGEFILFQVESIQVSSFSSLITSIFTGPCTSYFGGYSSMVVDCWKLSMNDTKSQQSMAAIKMSRQNRNPGETCSILSKLSYIYSDSIFSSPKNSTPYINEHSAHLRSNFKSMFLLNSLNSSQH